MESMPANGPLLLQNHSSVLACSILSFIGVIGVFNRITFPAFIVIPALQLAPHFVRKYVLSALPTEQFD